MSAHERRAERLVALLEQRGLDLLLVSDLVNVRYLCGFGGTSGVCVVGPDTRVFVTDFRYVERAATEVVGYEVVRGERDLLANVAEIVESVESRLGDRSSPVRLGFDDNELSVARHAKLLSSLGEAAELVPAGGLVEELRAVKDADELSCIAASAEIADGLYRWLIEEHGLAGHTERAVARALERRAQDCGADAVSFPPIVAAAENGALPHASCREVEIPRDTLVVVDLGCLLDAYCSDCTRTLATGAIDDEARAVYELVREAQQSALETARPGVDCKAVDAAARSVIEAAGHGDRFGHGVGHGVGMEVHEAPRLAPTATGVLEAGNVVTIEPGVYLPGRFGVRIEDLVIVEQGGPRVLTSTTKELTAA